MTKYDREEKALERLERENRELKNKIRSLTNSIRRLSKGYHKFLIEDKEDEAVKSAKKIAAKICWDCHGELKRLDIGTRYFYQCEGCLKTTPSKPINAKS